MMEWTRGKLRTGVMILVLLLMFVSLACGISRRVPESVITAAPLVEQQPVTISTATLAPVIPEPTQADAQPQVTAAPAATAVPDDAVIVGQHLGDTARGFGYAMIPLRIIDPADPGILYKAEEGKRLVAVEVVFANIAGEVIDVNPLKFTLYDTSNNEFDLDLMGAAGQIGNVGLYPGERIKGLVGYKVPEGAIAARLVFDRKFFSGDILEANLSEPPAGNSMPPLVFTPRVETSKLGQTTELSGYAVTALTVEDPTEPGVMYKAVEGYKLVAVEVTLENKSNQTPLFVNLLYAMLVDNNGYVYRSELFGKKDQITGGEMAQGEKITGWFSFVIPQDAAPAYFKYEFDSALTDYLTAGLGN